MQPGTFVSVCHLVAELNIDSKNAAVSYVKQSPTEIHTSPRPRRGACIAPRSTNFLAFVPFTMLSDNICAGKAKKVVVFDSFDSDKKGETTCVGKGHEPGQKVFLALRYRFMHMIKIKSYVVIAFCYRKPEEGKYPT